MANLRKNLGDLKTAETHSEATAFSCSSKESEDRRSSGTVELMVVLKGSLKHFKFLSVLKD
jgi:hypothetical protein